MLFADERLISSEAWYRSGALWHDLRLVPHAWFELKAGCWKSQMKSQGADRSDTLLQTGKQIFPGIILLFLFISADAFDDQCSYALLAMFAL